VLILFFPSDIFQQQKSDKVFFDRGSDQARAMARLGSEVSSTGNNGIAARLDRRINRRRYATVPTHVVLAVAHDELQERCISNRINRAGDSNQPTADFA
jgi:hypothetical protein